MKKKIKVLILIILALSIFILLLLFLKPPVKVFESYSFEDGGYSIVGISNQWGDYSKEVGSFLIDDITILNELKHDWTYKWPAPSFLCGYDYNIYLLKEKQIKDRYLVNLDCGTITYKKGAYYFNSNNLTKFQKDFKKVIENKITFNTIQEGKKYIESLENEKNFLLSSDEEWQKFEGSFEILYKDNIGLEKEEGLFQKEERIKNSFKKQIIQQYQDEKFKIESSMTRGDGKVFNFKITCNKSLYEKFSLTEKKAWEEQKISLRTYWK